MGDVSGKNILIVVACIAVILALTYQRDANVQSVSVCDISRAFRENEMAAIEKYDGKRTIVSGVAGVKGDSLNGLFLRVECADGKEKAVHCFFPRAYAGRLAEVWRGLNVSVIGKCGGETLGMVVFNNCRLLD